jgi:hypothetical protein
VVHVLHRLVETSDRAIIVLVLLHMLNDEIPWKSVVQADCMRREPDAEVVFESTFPSIDNDIL